MDRITVGVIGVGGVCVCVCSEVFATRAVIAQSYHAPKQPITQLLANATHRKAVRAETNISRAYIARVKVYYVSVGGIGRRRHPVDAVITYAIELTIRGASPPRSRDEV